MPGTTAHRGAEAVLHVDETRAVEPLERTGQWDREPAATYPFGV